MGGNPWFILYFILFYFSNLYILSGLISCVYIFRMHYPDGMVVIFRDEAQKARFATLSARPMVPTR